MGKPMNFADPGLREFRALWVKLSKLGACDTWQGMESQRVYREWCEAGRPYRIVRFIRERANIGSK